MPCVANEPDLAFPPQARVMLTENKAGKADEVAKDAFQSF